MDAEANSIKKTKSESQQVTQQLELTQSQTIVNKTKIRTRADRRSLFINNQSNTMEFKIKQGLQDSKSLEV